MRALEAALAREHRTALALREVGTALGATRELDDLLELILAKLRELLEADRATLFLRDDAHREFLSRQVVAGQVQTIAVPFGQGIVGIVAATGNGIRLDDAPSDPRFSPDWDRVAGYRTRSLLAVPLKNHVGKIIGVTQVHNKRGRRGFDEEDEAILGALSTQAAVAIDSAQMVFSLTAANRELHQANIQVQRAANEYKMLLELERATGRATALVELCEAALATSMQVTRARGAALLLQDEETGEPTLYRLTSGSRGAEVTPVTDRTRGLARLLGTGAQELVRVPRGAAAPLWTEADAAALPLSSEGLLAVPLVGEGRPFGMLAALSRRDAAQAPGRGPGGGVGLFDAEDARALELIAANTSTAIRLFWASEARESGRRLTAIGRLLSSIIHDLKTPMTVISGYAQLMADTDSREQRERYAESILRQFDVLAAMQREVLEFARGETTVLVRRIYVSRFFDELRRELEQELGARPIRLELRADTKLVARFDEHRVGRALHNLARNAVEAMGEQGGRLTVSAEALGDELALRVSDTGPGVPSEVRGRLFRSFVTAGKPQGTGLGLAMVKKVADEHGGRVEVESSPSGATFTLWLPLAGAPRERRGGAGEDADPSSVSPSSAA